MDLTRKAFLSMTDEERAEWFRQAREVFGPGPTPEAKPVAVCATCPFWAPEDEHNVTGRCHGLQPLATDKESAYPIWFRTPGEEWCFMHPGRRR